MNNTRAQGAAQENPLFQAANTVVDAATDAVNGAVNAVNNGAAAAANALKNFGTNVNKAVGSAAASVPQAMNSLIPFGNTGAGAGAAAAPANNKKNNAGSTASAVAGFFGMGGPANNKKNNGAAAAVAGPSAAIANAVNAVNNAVNNTFNTAANAANSSSWTAWVFGPLGVFLLLVIIFVSLFAIFNEQIRRGYEYTAAYLKQSLGLQPQTDIVAQIRPIDGDEKELTVIPQPPQEATVPTKSQSIAEKLLPSLGGAEVFNVSQNKFTYYDAEPLCKALGAELATYEQVKDAWSRGADWCNYGWVKGQMAVYPTQKGTYDKLQGGPEDQKRACGNVGLNGGVFDNPELRFGVNCYGKKPSQSAHDEKMLMEQGRVAPSAESLKVDKLIADFKAQADSLFVRPFSEEKWSTGMP